VNEHSGVASVINAVDGTSDASDTYPVGTTTVIWSVTDIHGNSTQCSFEVTISDDEAPSIACTADIGQTADAGACGAALSIAAPRSEERRVGNRGITDRKGTSE